MKLLGKLIINALALSVVAYLLPGFEFDTITALVVASIILGVVNTFIRPILQIVALPLTILTFGLGALLVNVVLLWFVGIIVPGFTIENFLTALLGSISLSLVSWFLHRLENEE